MKLRTVLFLLFCVLALVPVALFWVWPHSEALQNEYSVFAVSYFSPTATRLPSTARNCCDLCDVEKIAGSRFVADQARRRPRRSRRAGAARSETGFTNWPVAASIVARLGRGPGS